MFGVTGLRSIFRALLGSVTGGAVLRGAFIPVRIPSGLVAANRSHQVPQVISHGLGSVLWDLGFGVLGLGSPG